MLSFGKFSGSLGGFNLPRKQCVAAVRKCEVQDNEKVVSKKLPETIPIDGRGDSVRDAIREMWARVQPLEAKGFHPISSVEIVDEHTKQIVETYELTDPEFELHLKDKAEESEAKRKTDPPHAPEKKGHYRYVARIKLG